MNLRVKDFLSSLPKAKRREVLERMFDKLYRRAVELTKTNYCQVKCGTCVAGRLTLQEYNQNELKRRGPKFKKSIQFCCQGCKHLGPKGCTVEALACRAHFCWAIPLPSEIKEKLNRLNDAIWRWGLSRPRENKKDTIQFAMWDAI